MVSVTIQQDMSLILPMTSPIIDLTSRPESPKVHQQFKATTTETTTTTLPPPPAQQQSTAEAMMMKCIGELEHIMANLIQENKEMEERLDKHGVRLYTLEQLDIPQQVSKVIKSYKSLEDHIQLFEALEMSMKRYHSEELAQDLAKARKKKKKSRKSPKTPHGSPPHQPPPPPSPAGPSGALGAPGASRSSQVPSSPPPPSSTNQKKERPATLERAWSIPSSDVLVLKNNWASALASNYSPPPEDSRLAQTGDIATFMDWFCKRRECHKLLTDSVDDPILRHNVSKPLPLGGPPSQVTIQSNFFFNKVLEYLRYGSKGSKPALSISKMKAA
uniref:Uncharacterized protein n=1 Tax=Tanacetum cinerariifolium TaxID=118510 RepID=A0A6L2JPJ4_TANCI|nr:hypothetical protein [Tanacetum cinerariifolium]